MKKNLMFIILIIVIIAGCSKNEEESIKMLKETIQQLEGSNEELKLALDESRIKKSEILSQNGSLRKLNEKLENNIESYRRAKSPKDRFIRVIEKHKSCLCFDVSTEGIYINKQLFNPEEISEEVIIDLLGEPTYVSEYGGEFLEKRLSYDDNFMITFIQHGDEQALKLKEIRFNDSNFMTKSGITVGSSRNQILKAYGENDRIDRDYITYGSEIGIHFRMKDDYVKEIIIKYRYHALINLIN
jgi:hypothetical protein